MFETKPCKQCGETRPLTMFRKYYGNRKGRYNVCKICEKINQREKYLRRKRSRTVEDEKELSKIYKLWDTQKSLGLHPPYSRSTRTNTTQLLDDILDKYSKQAEALEGKNIDTDGVPAELLKWLSIELTKEPEYYLETVYDRLSETYRPVIKIDTDTKTPVYDETYKDTLDAVLARLYEYEEVYYGSNKS